MALAEDLTLSHHAKKKETASVEHNEGDGERVIDLDLETSPPLNDLIRSALLAATAMMTTKPAILLGTSMMCPLASTKNVRGQC